MLQNSHIGQLTTVDHWYDSEVVRQRAFEERSGDRDISHRWGHKVHGDDFDENLVRQMPGILTTMRNFGRIIGIPRNTEIRLAAEEDVGTACAGFYDAPDSFQSPFILMDEAVLKRCHPTMWMDIAIGLSIHESMHILLSREAYRRMTLGQDPTLLVLENLVEDWRIEEAARGLGNYIDYLYKLRKVLILDQSLRLAICNWDSLPDVERILAIATAYIRAPLAIERSSALKEWTDLQDRCIFKVLSTEFASPPATEADVEQYALFLYGLVKNYLQRSARYLSKHRKWDADRRARFAAQRQAERKAGKNDGRHPIQGQFRIDELAAAQQRDNRVFAGAARSMVEAIAASKDGATEFDQPAMHLRLPRQRIPAPFRDRIQLIESTVAGTSKADYQQAKAAVVPHIARLKRAFHMDADTAPQLLADRLQGRLDGRKLWRAPFSEAVFRQYQAQANERISLCILADASGSMWKSHKYRRAREMVAMFNEAFCDHPVVDAHFYAHSSLGTSDDKCVVWYVGRAGESVRRRINAITPSESNFDFAALWGVATHSVQNAATASRRYLLSISDGLPCAFDRSVASGADATRDAAIALRKQGWKVIGIGIGCGFASRIYGDRWTLRLPSAASLPADLANLVVKLLKS